MKTKLLSLLGATLLPLASPMAQAGVDIDLGVELEWRAEYDHDYDAAVILYEHRDFRGRRLILYPGEEWGNFDDYVYDFRVRSVEIFGPVHVVLYDENDFWGHEVTIYRDVRDLRDYRMRLSRYSIIDWAHRARSAYVSFTPREKRNSRFRLSVGRGIYDRVYWSSPVRRIYYEAPRNYRYYLPRPMHTYRPHRPPPAYRTPPPPRPGSRPGNIAPRPPVRAG